MLYGYDQNALAVYFNQGPIFSVGGGGGGGGRGGRRRRRRPATSATCSPTRCSRRLTTLDGAPPAPSAAGAGAGAGTAAAVAAGGGGGGFGGRGGGGGANPNAPRVLLSFPTDANDLLLSGVLVGGEAIAGRAVAIDAPIGKGHVVMFANRPVLALADAGELLPRLQHDPELERSGCRAGCDTLAQRATDGASAAERQARSAARH